MILHLTTPTTARSYLAARDVSQASAAADETTAVVEQRHRTDDDWARLAVAGHGHDGLTVHP